MGAYPANMLGREGCLAEGVVFWIYILCEQVIRAGFLRNMNHLCLSACKSRRKSESLTDVWQFSPSDPEAMFLSMTDPSYPGDLRWHTSQI